MKIKKVLYSIKQNMPAILTATSIATGVAATVFACKETLRAKDIVEAHKEALNTIEEAKTISEEYSNNKIAQTKDVVSAYAHTAVNFVKLYHPALILGAVSIGAQLTGFKVLNGRYLAASAAATIASTQLNDFKKEVEARYGKEVKDDISHEIAQKETVNGFSVYARFFDELNSNWQSDAVLNRNFLKRVQEYVNDRLTIRGYVFLNEVYDALGMPRSKAGAVVGWIKDGPGDGYIDFGLNKPESKSFMAGEEASILIDFNVDGPIVERIPEEVY